MTDNRTGRHFDVPIQNGAIRAADLTGPFRSNAGPGLVVYDPGLANTAICTSAITHIQLEPGLLEHRGYRIEELAAHSSYVEVAYLLIHGELPKAQALQQFSAGLSSRKFVHENLKRFISGFRYDAQPLAVLAAAVGALGSFYPEAGEIGDEQTRTAQIMRLLAKLPTLAAYAFRHGNGQPYVNPSDELSFVGNLLSMMFLMSELRYQVDPALERALEVLLIVHADHEQSAATTAVRAVGSAHVDPYAAVAAGVYALSGPMRGRADRDTLAMLRQIGSVDAVPAFLARVKAGEARLRGFGHWVYWAPDPRARVLREQLDTLAEHARVSPLLAVADELARLTAEDDYFAANGIHPNVDLYSGLTYSAIGIPEQMFGVMFAVARSAGWIAHWLEMLTDPEQTTVRPRQVYTGPHQRPYVPLAERR
ncbi:MAG TPA: citrate/2-methylcitrate synthase [Solirubrobacteraceae bacterium]|nr:citrate/2-methylcitrate synthase [Solirubrobacteraceae bacterium]